MSQPIPRIVRATVTPILISDPPLLNVLGVHQPYTPRTIVELETDTGATGVGETYGDTEYLEAARNLAKAVVGQPLTSLNGLHDLAYDSAGLTPGTINEFDPAGLRGSRTNEKIVRSVVSAFEVASLDTLGRTLGLPVHALLGGKVRDRVDYSGYLFYRWAEHPVEDAPRDDWGAALDPEGVVRQARRFTDTYGFRSFKLKGGVFPPEEEIAAIKALAEAFPDHPLRLDPNGGWSLESSVRVAEELDGLLEYLEDPTTGIDGMAQVRARTGALLATNMCVTTFGEIPEAFAKDAVQVVLSDHHYWGGLHATRELAALCRTYGVALSMHSNTHLGISLAAMTHVASVIPDLEYACDSHRPWQTEDVITEPHRFVGGALEVSDAPGLGVELDRDALATLHERWTELSGFRDRDDVAAMRVADPTWVQPPLPRW
ncbi:glucarate dehydratase family protein [Nonomuraea aurantiaca]|uniref:glucarate dehydratase family protein n=1 Tax=Nonomuraea aurantiaca TaxID=2878562 RepID=UPI001CD96EC9|nr:glucarate dehydratase family protein [Nonomuraea aurantiaca]MCA2225985.1 glucarate dehydratase family protein [Nonomuraea aurantiaca]